MPQHIQPFDNKNQPIVAAGNALVPLVYFNIIRLKQGECYFAQLAHYESVYVMAHGTCDLQVGDHSFEAVGQRTNLWEGKPDSVYVPLNASVKVTCITPTAEIYVAGGQIESTFTPFRVRPDEVATIQYGSDDTKTHRRIQHVLSTDTPQEKGRLLVSELFTVGAGGWSGFPPHKHDQDRPPIESHFEEVYLFRFKPEWGFGAQFCYVQEDDFGPVYHIKDGSTILIDKGYHPCVAAPGYEMYYFTIIVGKTQKDLLQYFDPKHAYQIETIPGIKDMIAGFKSSIDS